jgi:polygalacturonase
MAKKKIISINRASVLTLWAAVVARRLGFNKEEALTLGRAVAGLNAQAKGRRPGIFKPHEQKAKHLRRNYCPIYPRPPVGEGRVNVTIRDVTLKDSEHWNLHLLGCEDVTVDGIRINSNLLGPNSDGIDIEACRDVTVSDIN